MRSVDMFVNTMIDSISSRNVSSNVPMKTATAFNFLPMLRPISSSDQLIRKVTLAWNSCSSRVFLCGIVYIGLHRSISYETIKSAFAKSFACLSFFFLPPSLFRVFIRWHAYIQHDPFYRQSNTHTQKMVHGIFDFVFVYSFFFFFTLLWRTSLSINISFSLTLAIYAYKCILSLSRLFGA